MPVIRQGPDTTLADTLGNLGSAVTNVLNPLNQVRAQNFVSEIQQRAFELHQKQVFDDANRQAADAWERNNPWNEDPATLAAHAAGIRAGQPDFKGTADALIATANQGARSAAANLFRSRHQTDMDPDAVESGAADIQAGRKNASEVETDYNTGRLKKGEADTTGAFVTAAGAPGATVSSITGPAAAAAAARGNVEGATKSVAQGQDLSTPPPSGAAADITTPEGAAAFDTASKIRQIAGTGVAGQPPSAAFVPQQEATDVNKKILESRAAVHPLDQGASAVSGPVVVGAGPNAGVVSAPA